MARVICFLQLDQFELNFYIFNIKLLTNLLYLKRYPIVNTLQTEPIILTYKPDHCSDYLTPVNAFPQHPSYQVNNIEVTYNYFSSQLSSLQLISHKIMDFKILYHLGLNLHSLLLRFFQRVRLLVPNRMFYHSWISPHGGKSDLSKASF